MPVVELGPGQTVEVLLQLPDEAALANAALAGDGHHAPSAIPFCGVQLVLQQAQLVVTPDEWRLEPLFAARAADAGNDTQRAPRGHGRLLALEQLVAGRFVGDRRTGRLLSRLTDQHHPRRSDRLQP